MTKKRAGEIALQIVAQQERNWSPSTFDSRIKRKMYGLGLDDTEMQAFCDFIRPDFLRRHAELMSQVPSPNARSEQA